VGPFQWVSRSRDEPCAIAARDSRWSLLHPEAECKQRIKPLRLVQTRCTSSMYVILKAAPLHKLYVSRLHPFVLSVKCRDQIVLVAESHLHSSLSSEIQFFRASNAGTIPARRPAPTCPRPQNRGRLSVLSSSTSSLALAVTSLAKANLPHPGFRQRECHLVLFSLSLSGIHSYPLLPTPHFCLCVDYQGLLGHGVKFQRYYLR
jgi:hypothetical protein